MPTVLPLPALLVSQSTPVEPRSARGFDQAARHINAGESQSQKAKFAEALQSAESQHREPAAQRPDGAEVEPVDAAVQSSDEPTTAHVQTNEERGDRVEAEEADATQTQSEARVADQSAAPANQPDSRDSTTQSSATVLPPVNEAQPARALASQPTSTPSTVLVDQNQIPNQEQGQVQSLQQSPEPATDRASSRQIIGDRLQPPTPVVAETSAQTETVQSQRAAAPIDEQSAIQQHHQSRRSQPSQLQSQSARSIPAISDGNTTPQPAREPIVPLTNLTSQREPQGFSASQRLQSEHSPAPTALRANAEPAVQIEAQPQPPTPAVARAAQIDVAIRAEQAMAQATPFEQPAISSAHQSHVIHQPTLAPSLQLKSDNLAQQLPTLGAPIDDSPLTGQVVRGLSAMVNQRGGTMNLRLDPPDLGQLRIQMTVSRGVVTAEFHPTTPQAHDLLERNLAALRSTLEGQGLTVERLNVHVAAPSGNHHQMMRDDSNANMPNQHRQHHDAAGGESRGRRDGQSQQEFHREFAFADFQNLLNDLDQFALR